MDAEWVVYAGDTFKRGQRLHFASAAEWRKYLLTMEGYENPNRLVLVARGLTKQQAIQYVNMSKDE